MKDSEIKIILLCLESATGKKWVTEHRFHKTRRWRFDFANIEKKIAIEIEGGLWISGRHNRAPGMIKDIEKYNSAVCLGWRLLRYTDSKHLFKNIEQIKSII